MKLALAFVLIALLAEQDPGPRVYTQHSVDSGRTWATIGSAAYAGGVLYVWRRDTTQLGSTPVAFMRILWPVIQCQSPTRIGE